MAKIQIFAFLVSISLVFAIDIKTVENNLGAGLTPPDQLPTSTPITTGPGQYYSLNQQVYTGYIQPRNDSESRLFYQMFASTSPLADGSFNSRVPLLFWFNGGPGCTSQMGNWMENGPYTLIQYENGTWGFDVNPYSWNTQYHMVFIDQPVGVAFSPSFDDFYVNNTYFAASDMAVFFQKFFEIYDPLYDLSSLDIYLTGESYGGHYVPMFVHEVLTNSALKFMNLKGMIIGDGWVDALNQLQFYDTYSVSVGILDIPEAIYVAELSAQGRTTILAGEMSDASAIFDEITGYITNVSGNVNYDNFRQYGSPDPISEMVPESPDIMEYLGVTNYLGNDFSSCNNTMYYKFYPEISTSFANYVAFALDHLPVLLYNGQNDIIVNTPASEAWMMQMGWIGTSSFNQAKTNVWYNSQDELAGTYKIYQNLHFAIVYDAGHLVPADQPVNSLNLIERFIGNNWN